MNTSRQYWQHYWLVLPLEEGSAGNISEESSCSESLSSLAALINDAAPTSTSEGVLTEEALAATPARGDDRLK